MRRGWRAGLWTQVRRPWAYNWGVAFYHPLIATTRRIISHPVGELNRWQRSIRWFVELMRHCWRQLNEDRAEEMAAALTYRTIFSLVPLAVLGLVVFRIFGGFEVVQERVLPAAYSFFGVPEVADGSYATAWEEGSQGRVYGPELPPGRTEPESEAVVTVEVKPLEQEITEAQAAETDPAVAVVTKEEKKQVRGAIQKALNELIANISKLSFASIGVVGIVVFIYAAMTLALAVEYDFNIIFKSPTGRPWHLRVPIYWSIITLGSGLLGLSLYLTGEIVDEARELHVYDWLLPALSRVLAFIASWGMFFLLYVLVPNTHVRIRPALAGSFAGALLWEAAKFGFQTYVNHALPYAELYGALGLIPLFLFWVYISWVIVLFGLELTYAMQMMRGRWETPEPVKREECEVLLDPRWLLPLMVSVGESFGRGETASPGRLAERLALPVNAVLPLLAQLKAHGLLHCIAGSDEEEPGYTLAFPPAKIEVNRLLALGRDLSMHRDRMQALPGHELLDTLSRAEHAATNGATLATLLPSNGEKQVMD